MKTILYIGGFILPDGNAAAHRVLANAKAFSAIGYNVVFLGVSKDEHSNNLINTHKMVKGYRTFFINYPKSIVQWLKYLVSFTGVKIIITEIGKKNISAVVAYNYPAVALYRLNRYCNKLNIKLISDCTEWAGTSYSKPIHGIFKNIDTYLRMTKVHPKLDGIIIISKYLNDYYKNKLDNVVLIPPLIDKKEAKWKNNQIKSFESIKLIYAGSPGDGLKDRIDLVIDAISYLKPSTDKEIHLEIIGLTKEEYFSGFKKEIPNNVVCNVTFSGRITHKNVIRKVQNADFSIFLRETNIVTKAGFPTKFVESIACGTPVLTNASSNIADYMKENKFGYLININSNESLVNSLIKPLTLTKEQIFEMKKNCLSSNLFHFKTYLPEFRKIMKNKNI